MTALSTLPLAASGVISFELIELDPFAALGVLFATDVSEPRCNTVNTGRIERDDLVRQHRDHHALRACLPRQ